MIAENAYSAVRDKKKKSTERFARVLLFGTEWGEKKKRKKKENLITKTDQSMEPDKDMSVQTVHEHVSS